MPHLDLESMPWFGQAYATATATCVSLVASAVALLILYPVGSAIHSVTLHRLAGFPGPVSCAVSRIPFWITCITGGEVQWMHQLHVRYGPVVRYGPDDASFVDGGGAAWKALHRHDKGGREFPKAKEWFVTPANGSFTPVLPPPRRCSLTRL
jgi:hypothetical protein